MIKNWYGLAKIGSKSQLDSDEMVSFILDNSLQDWSGELDVNDAKQIAHASSRWVLTHLPLDLWDWAVEPINKTNSQNIPPIVLKVGDNDYEVLDGKHRIGMARARGEKNIEVYLGDVL